MGALITLNPTSFTNPDPSGGLAVTTPSNTGHASTTSTASGGTDSQVKSCRWTAFPAGPSPSARAAAPTLKVDYTRNGTLSDGGINTYNQFLIEYSLNGGSSWTALLNHEFVTSSSTSTASFTLSISQDLSQVQVRDFLTAQKVGGTSATMVATPSNIRIEVQTADNQLLIMM